MREHAEAFRRILETALKSLPQKTALGSIVGTEILRLGAPSKTHDEASFWRFESARTSHVLHFGFVNNFTPHDLMSKVSVAKEMPRHGAGASIQFNGDEAICQVEGGHLCLQHHGRVTVTHAIKRSDLIAQLAEVSPETIAHFGGIDEQHWPLRLGTTADLPTLIDNVFVWSFGVEQAKRSLRNEPLLPQRAH